MSNRHATSMNHEFVFYQVGATLSPDARSYIIRREDDEVLEAIRNSRLVYVFNARQMGKSSLETRLRTVLEKDRYLVTQLDLSSFGTDISAEQWYASLARTIADNLHLSIDFGSWWREQAPLSSLARFGNFLEHILLKQTQQRILISIDEIDSVLSLNFPTDDFFAFIRACYNKRSTNKDYQRLNFALFGVATPSDLIADVSRTPFNLGERIELSGFTFDEARILTQGFQCNSGDSENLEEPENSGILLKSVLEWTGGQPFLTQKLCELVSQQMNVVTLGAESDFVQQLVQSSIIRDWKNQDYPQHLRTIENRIIQSRKRPFELLGLYLQILQNGSIVADHSSLQSELQLTGLVRRTDGHLTLYNPIYKAVFNETWVKNTLEALRPYSEQMRDWLKSNQEDSSRLLRGQALKEANDWAMVSEDYLTDEDRQFLEASQKRYQKILEAYAQASSAAPDKVAAILETSQSEIIDHTSNPEVMIQEIRHWVGAQPDLAQLLCDWLSDWLTEHDHIVQGEEAHSLQRLVESRLYSSEEAKKHFNLLESAIRKDDRSNDIVRLYQTVREKPGYIAEDSLALRSLITLGLAENRDGELHIANRFYDYVFDERWVERILNRRLIDRYEVLEDLRPNVTDCESIDELPSNSIRTHFPIPLQVYRVTAPDLAGDQTYILQQLDLPNDDVSAQSVARRVFTDKTDILTWLKRESTLPDLIGFRPLYVVYKDVVGKNLDQEIIPGQAWSNDQVIQLLIEVLNILASAHRQGLTHLNLKPGNIRRRADGSLALIDFSLLKETYASTVKTEEVNPVELIGTEGYIPPELLEDGACILQNDPTNHASSEQVRQQWDIYSLGVTGIQALTTIEPTQLNRDPQDQHLLWRFIGHDQSRSLVVDGLARILDNMVHPDPHQRYQSVSPIIHDLEQLRFQRSLRPRFAWANLREKDWRFWSVAGTLAASLLIGTNLWSGFNAVKIQLAEQRRQSFESCIAPVISDSSDEENLISIDTLAQVTARTSRCGDYLKQTVAVPPLTFGRFIRGETFQEASSETLGNFDPMPGEDSVREQDDQRLRNTGDDGLRALISSGKASLMLQNVLEGSNADQELMEARHYFDRATRVYPSDPLGYFYLGVTEAIQSSSDASSSPELSEFHLEAIARYVLIAQGKNMIEEADITELIEPAESTTEDLNVIDISLLRYELTQEDFSALAILAYLWSQDPKIGDLHAQYPELLNLQYDFDVVTRLYTLARQADPSATSLLYNEAVAYATAGNMPVARGKFQDIINNQEDDSTNVLRRFAEVSLVLLEATQPGGNYADILEVRPHLPNTEEIQRYLDNLEVCSADLRDPDCNPNQQDWRSLPNPGRIFQYVPMVNCRENISLALAYRDLCFMPQPSSSTEDSSN
ncbi:MAG: AAA-like domain-containing protein [Synechococcales cyanobacterium K44_A2020_017]|nr:AAA-like domain-containing protein [Synechococcales cyanobacterium K32_A2020_035]MBF2093151.1 AAA-like domain-containing protein [Synechococcales cyanobacterium K44_A2020_017]